MIGTTNTSGISGMAFKGATSTDDGRKGLVPTPTTADIDKFLSGDGKWKSIRGNGVNVIRDVLWEGQAYTQKQTLTLAYDYQDYDYIYANILNTNNNCIQSTVLSVNEVMNHDGMITWLSDSTTTSSRVCCSLNFSSNTASFVITEGMTSSLYLSKIEGIKFINPNIYSTTEQRIGTWIDGKPIYQITLTGTTPSGATEGTVATIPASVDSVQNIEAIMYTSYGPHPVPLSYLTTSQDDYAYIYVNNSNDIRFKSGKTAYWNIPINVTIKYTKTTD